MQPISLLKIAHNKIKEKLPASGFAIDATVGNGHDTLFLAQQVGNNGIVYGFDIQQAALAATRMKLEQAQLNKCVQLFLVSHDRLADYIACTHQGNIHAAMFNLGYLPGADKAIITESRTTLEALQVTLALLAPNGLLTITAYPGHPGGGQETEAIAEWCNRLDPNCYSTELINSPFQKGTAPRLFVINKQGSTS